MPWDDTFLMSCRLYEVWKTRSVWNGDIPTIWIIVRDLSASLRFGRDDKLNGRDGKVCGVILIIDPHGVFEDGWRLCGGMYCHTVATLANTYQKI